MPETKTDTKTEAKPTRTRAPKAESTASKGGLDIPVAPAPAETTSTRPVAAPKAPKGGWWWGTGRRKRAVARVRIRPAKGDAKVMIALDGDKTKTIDQYFAEDRDRANIYAPLRATGAMGKMDVIVRVNGGGFMGQAGAIVQGLARALKGYDPQMDAKKYGQAGARRRFQFSKR